MDDLFGKVAHKLQDGLLLEAVYDALMKRTRFNTPLLADTYNIFVGQKHRMLSYKRLKRQYLDDCLRERPWEAAEKRPNPGTVWVCWLQGFDKAPPIVRQCRDSLCRHLPHKTICEVDENNVFDYIRLPDFILKKRAAGVLSPQQFSDFIRLELLARHGGYWIDATVFLTDAGLLELVDDLPLFMYSFYYFGFNPEIMRLNNWFILSTTNNDILCLTQKLMYAYWERETRLVNYFLFHLMNTMALEYYEADYRRMPIVSQADAHVLASYIFDAFETRKFDILKRSTGIHKLSTRFDLAKKQGDDTFYDRLLDGKLR